MPIPSVRLALLALALVLPIPYASTQNVGAAAAPLFQQSTDIGQPLRGSTKPAPHSSSLLITGGGNDMWGTRDSFRLAWIQIPGNATFSAQVEFPPHAAALAKAVLIFRQNLRPDSSYADIAIHGDGHVTLQYRSVSGAPTSDITSPVHSPARIQIERKGDVFTASTVNSDGTVTAFAQQSVPLKGLVYVGLGVCAHDPGGLISVKFSDIKLATDAQSRTHSAQKH